MLDRFEIAGADAFEICGDELLPYEAIMGYEDPLRDSYLEQQGVSVFDDDLGGVGEFNLFDPKVIFPLLLLYAAVFGPRGSERIAGAEVKRGPEKMTRKQAIAELKRTRAALRFVQGRRRLMYKLLRKHKLARELPPPKPSKAIRATMQRLFGGQKKKRPVVGAGYYKPEYLAAQWRIKAQEAAKVAEKLKKDFKAKEAQLKKRIRKLEKALEKAASASKAATVKKAAKAAAFRPTTEAIRQYRRPRLPYPVPRAPRRAFSRLARWV